jgi:hypothetical protein
MVEADNCSSSSGLSSTQNVKHEKMTKVDTLISTAETKHVNQLKIVALLVLVGSAVGVALVIYYYLRSSEIRNFEDSFSYDSQKVLQAIGASIENNLGAMDSFAINAVSFARASNQSFPFVTFPDFPLRATKLRALSDGMTLAYQPVVLNAQRTKWETYAVDNQAWVNSTLQMQVTDEFYYGTTSYDLPNPTTIFNLTGTMPYDRE